MTYRNVKFSTGTAVAIYNCRHIIGRNNVDLLTFRCEESVWRYDLSIPVGDEPKCEKCYDENFVPWYDNC